MALTAILHKSASMAARVVGTPWKSRHCAAFSAAKLCAANRPNMFHSVSADKKLLEVLQSEVDAVVQSEEFGKEVVFPSNLPFSLVQESSSDSDSGSTRNLSLTRDYQGEEDISVIVGPPCRAHSLFRYIVAVYVRIDKTDGSLQFDVYNVLPDKIIICNVVQNVDDSYYDYQPLHLNENLQKAFLGYLEVRGINLSDLNFLHEHMAKKKAERYIWWLNEVMKFVQA